MVKEGGMTRDRPVDRAGAGLRELILAGEQYRHVVARYLGLTVSESQAVSYLLARGPMGQKELGDALGFNTSSTTALVDRLERNNIAERVADPTDRRRSTVQLSAHGQKTAADATGWIIRAFDNIDPKDLPDLGAQLHLIATNLRAGTSEIPADSAPPVIAPRRRR